MPTKTVDIHDAQLHLVELLSLVTTGTEIVLTEGNTPLARIVPMADAPTPRSCRNRSCPKCHRLDTEAWLAERRRELLPVPYFHVVFTVPVGCQVKRVPF
jgi:antitoxin (DNA-binding transcriptional repressor) of toxin-antitoxin stability system